MFGQHLVKVLLNSLDSDCPSMEEKWAACEADMPVAMLTKDLQELKPYCVKYLLKCIHILLSSVQQYEEYIAVCFFVWF